MQLIAWVLSLLLLVAVPASVLAEDSQQVSRSWYDEVGEAGIDDLTEEERRSGILRFSLESDALSRASNACRIEVLQKLGWQLQPEADRAKFGARAGNPCDDASLDASLASGELRVLTPRDSTGVLNTESTRSFLDGLLLSDASVCAYKFRVAPSAQAAAQVLSANTRFEFNAGRPFVKFYGASIPWLGSCLTRGGDPLCYVAKNLPSAAMHQFTEGRTGAECAVGLQVAEFETLHQLYGESAFDRHFGPREIAIGPWSQIQGSGSATWGRMKTSDTMKDKDASYAAKTGPRWLEGLSGYIGNVFGEGSLDRPVDRGENFLTVSVSQEAFGQLSDHGSFGFLNRWNHRLYELSRGMNATGKELIGNQASLDGYRMTPEVRRQIEEARKIIRQPIYTGYEVYVHPLGRMTFGQHIHRLLKVNPRTPYAMTLYPSRVHRGLYRRYLNYLAEGCAQ